MYYLFTFYIYMFDQCRMRTDLLFHCLAMSMSKQYKSDPY
uniref:Uncharacterized protein n=1 Tax=Anguilla anguilla TaxID=7936 RepID=A0A0E9SIS6_ANGAN